MLIPRDADFDLYPYTPSATAGWAFLVLFAAGGIVHLCMMIIYRSWFFIPFILGCAGKIRKFVCGLTVWNEQLIPPLAIFRRGGWVVGSDRVP